MASELSRWEPMRELASLRDEMERMFRQTFGGAAEETPLAGWYPALDVEETDDAFEVHVEIPGVDPEDVEITLDEGVLAVTGERRFYEDKTDEGFRRIERRFGRFQRSLRLPAAVDAEQVEATYADGMLSVTVPKTEAAKPRKITIKSD